MILKKFEGLKKFMPYRVKFFIPNFWSKKNWLSEVLTKFLKLSLPVTMGFTSPKCLSLIQAQIFMAVPKITDEISLKSKLINIKNP